MKRTRLLWFAIVTLIVSLNLVSCSSNGGGTSSTTTTILTTTTTTTISTTTTTLVGTDTSFGTGGVVTTAIGTDDEAFALAIQSDGKLVAAGTSFSNTLIQNVWAVVRYNTDGSLDTTFNTTGIVTTQIGTTDDEALALAIQSDGKLVTAGQSYNDNTLSQYVFALVRYNTDGTPDTTFGTGGIVTTQIGTADDISFALAIQSDGKLVAAGISNNGTQEVMALVRYNTDGTPDTTFGTGGIVTTQIGTTDDEACALAIQSDGKLVTAGFTYDSTLTQDVWAVVRYNTDGSLDTTFGTGGIVTTPVGNNDDAEALAIQSDGKLVTAGDTGNGSQIVFVLVRYNTDGTPDMTFGTGGIVTTAIGTYDEATALAIDSNGKPVAAGFSNYGTLMDPLYEFALVRYTTAGALDTTFHTTGIVTTRIGTIDDEAFALKIQSDGKMVAAGYSDNGTQNSFALVRYLP